MGKTDKEAILRLFMKLAGRIPCKYPPSVCSQCCTTCSDLLTCYRSWKRGWIRVCKNYSNIRRQNRALWCSSIRDTVADLLGEERCKSPIKERGKKR